MFRLHGTNPATWFWGVSILTILLALLLRAGETGARTLEDEGWTLVFDEPDIRVYRRLEEGSDIVETLTRATFDAQAGQVFAVITDYANYPDFMPHVVESRIIEQTGNTQTLMQRISIAGFLSFMIKDRFHVVSNRLTLPEGGNDSYRIEWSIDRKKTRDMKPDDTIATRLNDGYWKIQGIDGGSRSEVSYYLHTDPGGSIPSTLVNTGTTRSIPAVIRAIADRLGDR